MVLKTREKLIEVARQLFVHKGLENTTMNDIANASEKGRRTIYTYFRNKKEIYNAVLEHESDSIVSRLRQIVESDDEAPEKLRKFLTVRLEQGKELSTAYSSLKSLLKFDMRRMSRIRRLVFDKEAVLFNTLIDRGVAEGYFDGERAAMLKSFIIPVIQGMDLAEIDADNDPGRAERQKTFVDFIVSDIARPNNNRIKLTENISIITSK